MGERNDELQVPAVRSQAPRPVCSDDDAGDDNDDASADDNGEDHGDDSGGDDEPDDFADTYNKWSEYERRHRFDTPITD